MEEKAEPIQEKILDQRLGAFPKPLQDDLRALVRTPVDERRDAQKYLATKFETVLKVELSEAADAGYRKAWEQTEQQTRILQSCIIPEPMIRALWDRGQPSPNYLLRRGNSASFWTIGQSGVPSAAARYPTI